MVVTIFIGWRTVGESRAARETATEQARLAKETLDVSRRTLAEAEMQRALGSPFELEIALEESVAGSAIIVLRN